MCVSCPQACMTPTSCPSYLDDALLAKGTSTSSRTGKPVHVGAQRHHRARPAALEDGDDAGAGDAGLRLEPEGLEAVGDVFRRLDLAVGELRALVQIPAPLEQFGLDRGGQLVDLARERRCAAAGSGPCCAWTDEAASKDGEQRGHQR